MAVEKKRLLILEAAVKRFSHFGLSKTTMADIAKDLAFSKALLYYYYSDKHSLYAAAFSHVVDQKMEEAYQQILAISDLKEAMLYFVTQRMEFVKAQYSFLQHSNDAVRHMPKAMNDVLQKVRADQHRLFCNILQNQLDQYKIKQIDKEELANLFLVVIEGVRLSMLKNTETPIYPSKEEFDTILYYQKEIVSRMIDGLMN